MTPPLPREDLRQVLELTRPLWEEMQGGRLFLTGGTGFFGMWLAESFLFANDALGLNARAMFLTRDRAAFAAKAPHIMAHGAVELLDGDVRSFAFPPGEYTHVIHAATTSSAPVPPVEMLETILTGTRRVLDFASAARATKLLFTSSGAVYGPQPPELTHLPETYAGVPDTAYGEGKRAAELLDAPLGIEVKIARCFAFVGPHLPLDAHFAIGNFIRDALAGVPLDIRGDGTPMRSYLYAADLAVWLWTILFRGAGRRPYNVGSEEALSIADLAGKVRDLLAPALPIDMVRAPDPSRPPLRYVPATGRAGNELGLRVSIPLAEAIVKTAAGCGRR